MSELQIVITLAVSLCSFFAGWLAATEKIRIEVYKARLDAYRNICRKSSKVLMATIRVQSKSLDPARKAQMEIDLSNAGLDLTEEILAAGALVSESVMKEITIMNQAHDIEDYNKQWHCYIKMAHIMAKDLGLKESFEINEKILNPLRRFFR